MLCGQYLYRLSEIERCLYEWIIKSDSVTIDEIPGNRDITSHFKA